MDNPALGRQVLDIADTEPLRFDMGAWAERNELCGMTACLGGHAMLLSGYTCRLEQQENGTWDYAWYRPDGTEVGDLPEESAKLLGMSEDEEYDGAAGQTWRDAVWFDGEHGLDRFRKLVEEAEGAAEP